MNKNSEFVGIDGEIVLEAKCLSNLKDAKAEDIDRATRGIFQLWSTYFRFRKDSVVKTAPHTFGTGERSKYFNLLMSIWLAEINSILENSLLPTFNSKKIKSNQFRGKIDFLKSLVRNFGLIGSIDTTVNQINYDIPHLRIIKEAFELLSKSNAFGNGQSALEKGNYLQVQKALKMLRPVPSMGDIAKSANIINSEKIHLQDGNIGFAKLPKKLNALTPVIKFSLDFILGSDFNVNSPGMRVGGIRLNLNYLLEYVLGEALKLNRGRREGLQVKDGKINRIRLKNRAMNVDSKRWMNPDCFGIIEDYKAGLDLLYIVDAKHKSFFSDKKNLNKLDREDYYQIVAYAATHSKQSFKVKNSNIEYFYALVGLAKEEELLDRQDRKIRYFDCQNINIIEIDYDVDGASVTKNIHTIPFKFAQFLYDIGKTNNENEIRDHIKRVGEEILKVFDDSKA